MQRRHLIALSTLTWALAAPAIAQTGEVRIAHVYSKTGPLEAYGKQTQTGLMMGLDYATGGTMMVGGKKLVVIEKDDQGKPDLGKSLLAAAYADDKADVAVGPTSSGVALAMLPVAEEYKKILLVEPAVADANVRVVSGFLEASNVNAVDEMTSVLALAKQFELHIKMMNTAKEDDQAMTRVLSIS